MENKEIVVASKPNTGSFIRFNNFLMTRTKRAIAFWFSPGIFFILGLLLVLVGEPIMGITFIVIAPLVIALMLFINRMNAKLVMKSSKFYSDAGDILYRFSDSGIDYKTNSTSFSMKWSDIYRAYETNRSFYIMIDTIQAVIIEKEFITEEQSRHIHGLLINNLEKKKFILKGRNTASVKYASEAVNYGFDDTESATKHVETEKDYDITVTTTLTFKSYIKFNYFHLFKGANRIVTLIFPVIFLIISLLNYMSGDLSGAVTYIVFAVLIVPFMLLMIRMLVKKNFKSNKYLANISDIFFGFNSEGFTQVSKASRVSFKWEQVYRVYETKDYFYIYASRLQSFILNKNDFAEGKVDALRELMKNNLTKKQYRIKG